MSKKTLSSIEKIHLNNAFVRMLSDYGYRPFDIDFGEQMDAGGAGDLVKSGDYVDRHILIADDVNGLVKDSGIKIASSYLEWELDGRMSVYWTGNGSYVTEELHNATGYVEMDLTGTTESILSMQMTGGSEQMLFSVYPSKLTSAFGLDDTIVNSIRMRGGVAAIGTVDASQFVLGANNIVGIALDGTTARPSFPLGLVSTGTLSATTVNSWLNAVLGTPGYTPWGVSSSGQCAFTEGYFKGQPSGAGASLIGCSSSNDTASFNATAYRDDQAGTLWGFNRAALCVLQLVGANVLINSQAPFNLATSNTTRLSLSTAGKLTLENTDSSGTPGAATVNKMSGLAAIAAGQSSVTITNSLVTATSIVIATLQTADGTLTQILRAVPGAGSFVITGNANATGIVKVGWLVIN